MKGGARGCPLSPVAPPWSRAGLDEQMPMRLAQLEISAGNMAHLQRIPQSECRVLRPRRPLGHVFLWLVVAMGCRERSSVTEQRFDAVSSAAVRPPEPSLYTEGALDTVFAEIRQRVGDVTSVLMLELTTDRAVIQVEAPTRPGYVVQYEWDDGNLRGPVPVELRGSGSLEANLFPLSAVALDQVPGLAKAAVERIDREHGQVERIVVRRNLPVDEAVGIRVYVDSPIRSSHIDADGRGKIAEVSRLP
jgi:hypothetical protein